MSEAGAADLDEWVGPGQFLEPRVAGEGRRGLTLRAVRASDGRPVAVKVGSPLGSDRVRQQFGSDATRLQSVVGRAPLAPVLGFGVGPTGRPWLVEPWFDGRSLEDTLVGQTLSAGEVVEALRRGATALTRLHDAHVLHANLRPAAMLRDAHGEWWVDGVALPALAPPAPGQDGPAPLYTPGEVLEGSGWEAASDVWTLGACLYTALTGSPPWARAAHQGRVRAVLAMSTEALSAPVRPDLPEWLTALVFRCLAVDPAARPAARAVLDEVERAAPSEPVTLAPAAGPLVEGRPLGSSYLLLEPVGSGASGQVWRGQKRWDGQEVAVKVLRPELAGDPETVIRFLRERANLVGVEHPNLVRVRDLVAEGDTLAIVMDLVDGPDMRRLLRERGPMEPGRACRLLGQAASGLATVHAAGLVHRDMKPENVLVDRAGTPAEQARVTDFGIARSLSGPGVTRADQLLGTAGYLAPELVAGREVTPAADVYSLGVMAYELVSGRRPFEGEHPASVLRAHLDEQPVRPAAVPDGLWAVIDGCLVKDPRRRPDAARLAGLLLGLADGVTPAGPLLPAAAATWAPAAPRRAPGLAAAFAPPGPSALFPAGPAGLAGSDPAQFGPGPAAPAPPVPVGGPPAAVGADPWSPAGDEQLTSAAASPLDPAPPPVEEARRGRSPRFWIAAAAVVLLVGAATGVTLALRSGSGSPRSYAADVTLSVAATRAGAVTVTWSDVVTAPNFVSYLLFVDRHLDSTVPSSSSTSLTIDGVAPGNHCFQVAGLFQSALPKGLPAANISKECVTVP